ncbi:MULTISPECIES: FtsB family cell division protein [Anaerotignum]|uniref:FtsB family cell division protein n=1 Tax=Anaerotignum TaxID=2039240 RepID=UPI0021091686|nr:MULTISPECIES: septum formation initiator family protein [Anaerotignum]MCQ4937508.1 septum formation initiator family protein [Anaerotignum propionicum]
MRRKRKQKDQRRENNGKKTPRLDKIFIRIFLSVFVCAVALGVLGRSRACDRLKQERMDVASQIQLEQDKKLELEERKKYYNSDGYIEQIAKEQLGMIKPNEILYINRGQ